MAEFMGQRPVPPIPWVADIHPNAAAQTVVVSKNARHRSRHLIKENAQPDRFLKYCPQIADRRVPQAQTAPFFLRHILGKLLRTDPRVLQRVLIWIISGERRVAQLFQFQVILRPGFQFMAHAHQLVFRERRFQLAVGQRRP
jgi:hypothetical protein